MTTALRRTLRPATLALMTAGLLAAPPGVATPSGQAQKGGAPQTVDFVAITADGQPVTDLTAAQITLKVGGKDRAITSLDYVKFGAGAASGLPAPFATNTATDAPRSFLLVVDEESLRPGLEATVRDSLAAFEKTLSPGDRLGLFTIPRGTTALAPTTDRAQFQAAITGLQGRSKTSTSSADRLCLSRDSLLALAGIMGNLAGQATPTPVVFFNAALSAPTTGPASLGSSSNCQLTPNEFQRVAQAADAGRAQLFIVRAEDARSAGTQEGLENLATITGAPILPIGTAADGAMTRIGKQTGGYYVASFVPDAAERNGASQRLELRSTRPDVRVLARSGVLIAKGAGGDAMTPQNMLRTSEAQRGFGLRALVVASRNDGDAKNTVKLVGLAEPVDPSVKLAAAAAGVYDIGGKLIAQWTAKPEELQRSPLAAAMAIPSGLYRVRIAAVDTQGRAATVDSDIATELTSLGVAQMGGLLIGTASPGFMPKLTFGNDAEMVVFFELYGRPTVGFAGGVEIAATADGPAIVQAPVAASATPVADKFMLTAKLPIASLKPGDYVVRAKLQFEGQPEGVLRRTIRKQ